MGLSSGDLVLREITKPVHVKGSREKDHNFMYFYDHVSKIKQCDWLIFS
jgi:hypothetical protein